MKLRNSIIALGLMTSLSATADEIVFDFSQWAGTDASINITNLFTPGVAPTDLVTDGQSSFSVEGSDFTPMSTYMDDNGTAGLNVGDSVVDTATMNVIIEDALNSSGTDGYWSVAFDYQLNGTLVDIDANGNYNAQFTSGIANFSLYSGNISNGSEQFLDTFLTFEFTNMAAAPTGPNSALLALMFEATAASDGVVLTNGENVFDILNDGDDFTNFNLDVINLPLSDLNEVPAETSPGVYERQVTADSPDLYFARVSEPGTLAVFGLGLLGLAGAARRRK